MFRDCLEKWSCYAQPMIWYIKEKKQIWYNVSSKNDELWPQPLLHRRWISTFLHFFQFCGLRQNVKKWLIFSCLSNWCLRHLPITSTNKNKMAIGLRAIQNPSDCDQLTIVGRPNFNLTNGIIFPWFSVNAMFLIIPLFCSDFINFSFFWPKLRHFILIQINNWHILLYTFVGVEEDDIPLFN